LSPLMVTTLSMGKHFTSMTHAYKTACERPFCLYFSSLVKIKNICLKSNIYQYSDKITIGLWYLTDRMLLNIGRLVDHLMHIDYKSEVYHIEINDLSDQELFWAINRAIAR